MRYCRAMASKTVVLLEDDVDGSDASETIAFGLDGMTYEIDLSDKNATALRGALDSWISHARKTGGGRRRSPGSRSGSDKVDTKAVRAWAASNGVPMNARGRVSAEVIEQYRKAGN